MTLKWNIFHLTKHLFLPQFTVIKDKVGTEEFLLNYDLGQCNFFRGSLDSLLIKRRAWRIYTHLFLSFICYCQTGSFSCLRGNFKLVRNVGNFLISKYIPSFLIVNLTFIGFWIPTTAYPARVALCITALLSLITQQYQNSLNVSYVYALSVWMMICIFFVFASLMEYSFAISDWSERVVIVKGKYSISDIPLSSPSTREERSKSNGQLPGEDCERKNRKDALKSFLLRLFKPSQRNNSVDMISRVVFPGCYIFVTIIYFCIYVWHKTSLLHCERRKEKKSLVIWKSDC